MLIERITTFRRVTIAALLAAAAWILYYRSVVPLKESKLETSRRITELREEIETAERTLTRFVALEQRASRGTDELNRLKRELPEGTYAVWFPKLIQEHFPSFGIPVAIIRLGTAMDEPDFPEFQRVHWAVGLEIASDNRNVPNLLSAVAEIDGRYPFLKVTDFAIRPDPKNPQQRTASVTIAALIPK